MYEITKEYTKKCCFTKCSVNERNITLSKADNEFHKCNNLVLYSRCYFKVPQLLWSVTWSSAKCLGTQLGKHGTI